MADSTSTKNLRGCGVSTPYTLCCVMCTINSELNYFPIVTNLSEPESLSLVGSGPATDTFDESTLSARKAIGWLRLVGSLKL